MAAGAWQTARRVITGAVVCALILQVHLAMYHTLHEEMDERYGALDRRLRAAARAAPGDLAAVDEILGRHGLAANGTGYAAAIPGAALEDLKLRHLALFRTDLERLDATRGGAGAGAAAGARPQNGSIAAAAGRVAAGAPVAAAVAAGAGAGAGAGAFSPAAPLAAPPVPGRPLSAAPAAAPVDAPAGPGCADNEEEPQMQWQGHWVDFGKPASDSLIRMRVDGAVAAGLQYTQWDRWRWRRRCGSEWARVGARIRPGADETRIKYVRIWGERNSCTTMVTDLLSRNLDLKCDGTAGCVSGGLPNKHDFMRGANVHDHEETLNILVSRHPYEWLASMRRHPFYAGLHYDKSMTDFLTQEWASFRLRDLDDADNKKSPATLRENGNITVEWGRARSVGPCAWAGQLDRMQECHQSEGRGGASGRAMRCTRIPGLVPSMWKNDQDGGAGMLGEAASLCANATESLKHCRDEMFLCAVAGIHVWEHSGWRAHLESALHARGKMQAMGTVAERKGKFCYRKLGGTVVKEVDQMCAPAKYAASPPEDLYECQKVPEYEVGQGFELAPSPTCLSGGYAWGVCEEGMFLCRIMRLNVWHGDPAQRSSWQHSRELLKSATRLSARAGSLRWHAAHITPHAARKMRHAPCAVCAPPCRSPLPSPSPSHAAFVAFSARVCAHELDRGQACSMCVCVCVWCVCVRGVGIAPGPRSDRGPFSLPPPPRLATLGWMGGSDGRHWQQTFGADKDPDMGTRFPSIAALRTAKLRDWFRVSQNMSFTTHLACRDLYLEPSKVWLFFVVLPCCCQARSLGLLVWSLAVVTRCCHLHLEPSTRGGKCDCVLSSRAWWAVSERDQAQLQPQTAGQRRHVELGRLPPRVWQLRRECRQDLGGAQAGAALAARAPLLSFGVALFWRLRSPLGHPKSCWRGSMTHMVHDPWKQTQTQKNACVVAEECLRCG